MRRTLTQYRSFERPIQLLLLNQFAINLGFYMLMPYLADHLSGELRLATWTVGLILGVRNLSQQGMFLVGGSLADRLGYKPLIVAGCVLRTGGFALLGLVNSVPTLLVASAATGFAGALFNPAVRGYLAHDAGERRVEAFALFNVFYQAGILAGPLLGLVLTGVTFKLTCVVAAAIFAVLSILQVRSLPERTAPPSAETNKARSVVHDWKHVIGNSSFVLFSAAMIGFYVLAFQVYLALPLETRRIAGDGLEGTASVTALFAASAIVAIVGQVSVTAWCKQRWTSGTCLIVGLVVMALAFVIPLLADITPVPTPAALQVGAFVAGAAVLALGTAIVFPFEMDTIVELAKGDLVATHYGLYSTICGVGILTGNLLTGRLLDLARDAGVPALVWLGLSLVGVVSAVALHLLQRSARLVAHEPNALRTADVRL